MADVTENVESVLTHSNDPLLSGEDRLKLNELMELCTSLSQRVIALETTKTNQALEIDSLKRRVKKLERKKGLRTHRLGRLFKVGRSVQVVSSEDKGLGAQEDASKQGRKIADLDADGEQEVKVEKVVSTTEVTTASATTTNVDELTLAQTLIEIKAAKPKAVTTAATTTTTVVTRPKARGVVVQEPSEFTTTTSPSQPSQLPQAKDKGKEKMVEPEKPLKKKDQILIDKEIAQRLQEELQVELEEEERLARQKEENANIAKWDNVQAMIDADYELATRLQAQEQEELTIEERSKMFVELIDKRKKHFARLSAEEQRKKPPTKAQKRSQIYGYRVGKKSFKKAEMVQESSSKTAGEELESDNSKKEKYPLTPATIIAMLSKKLQADHWNEMCYQLLKLMTKQLKNPGSGRIVGIKRLHDDLGVNTAKVRVTAAKHNLVLLVILVKNMLSISAAGIKVNAAGYNC
ncbi:hypothetical protein Tco_0902390 [Tanacetum coccineum]